MEIFSLLLGFSDLKQQATQTSRLANELPGWGALRVVRKVDLKCKLVKEISSKQLKGLILAQNERWRRGLGMQVAR